MRLSSESTSWTRTHPRHIDLSISKTSQLLCSPLPFLCHRLTRRYSYFRQALQAAGGIFISHRRISRFQSLHPVRSRSCNLLAVPLSLRRFSFAVRQRREISRGRSRAPPISKSVRSSRREPFFSRTCCPPSYAIPRPLPSGFARYRRWTRSLFAKLSQIRGPARALPARMYARIIAGCGLRKADCCGSAEDGALGRAVRLSDAKHSVWSRYCWKTTSLAILPLGNSQWLS